MITSMVANRYKAVQVKTCSPGELLVMLYDGVFRFIDEAEAAMLKDDRARVGDRINRAHAILTEFIAGLDKKAAPELCENLEAVYSFCMGQLIQANLHQNPELFAQVKRVLTPLREGFRAAVKESQAKGSTP